MSEFPRRYILRPRHVAVMGPLDDDNVELIAMWCGGIESDGRIERVGDVVGLVASPGDYVVSEGEDFSVWELEAFERAFVAYDPGPHTTEVITFVNTPPTDSVFIFSKPVEA